MADVVNLDALIPRDDFLSSDEPGNGTGGESGKVEASITDLRPSEIFFTTLRKPDFQRETAAWSPTMVKDFVKAFIEDDLIPSVICWQSASRLSFVIDGAHRLSAIVAWILDDYGDGRLSQRLYGLHIPDEQLRVAKKTRDLIKAETGTYKDFQEEIAVPGSVPFVSAKVRALAHSRIPLLWVKGSDSLKAERAFFTINQSAVEIDPTELKILNARTEPNAIAARAIVRNATGHRYWGKFSEAGQEDVEATGKAVYAALYSPPLDPPIRTEDLPIARHGYGTQTLPLIFELVNIANGIPVVDTSRSKRRFTVEARAKPDEAETRGVIGNAARLCRRITGTHPSSLGLHPAVYFYSANGRHQPTTVLAMAQLLVDVEKQDRFLEFTRSRKVFEGFLVHHKMYVNQLTVRHGSMVKGYAPIRDYYEFLLSQVGAGANEKGIETALRESDKYQTLVKEKPTLSKKAKPFSANAKQFKLLSDVLERAFVCNVCGARIDKKSMHLDHKQDKSRGGTADLANGQWLHPYCDSTYKNALTSGATP